MQRPLGGGPLTLARGLSGAERGYLQAMAAERFGRVVAVLRALPRPMLLVFRNINTVRSIHAALGSPADRYGLMAKRWGTLGGTRGGGWCVGVVSRVVPV